MDSRRPNRSQREQKIEKLTIELARSKGNGWKHKVSRLSLLFLDTCSRVFDIVVSVLVILCAAIPLYLLFSIASIFTGKSVMQQRIVSGQYGKPCKIQYFNISWKAISCIALQFSVVTGKLSLVGRTITDWNEHDASAENGYLREIKPGIFSLWQVRNNSRIGHEGSLSAEWEYRFTKGFFSDIGLVLRAIPAHFFSTAAAVTSDTLQLFGISFANTTMEDAVKIIESHLLAGKTSQSIFFVNPDCLNKSFGDRSYYRILKEADHVFPDGIGIVVASKMLGTPLKENVNGTDMLPYLCRMASENKAPLFLLGGKEGVAERMKGELEHRYDVTIAGCHHGYFDHQGDSSAVIEKINRSGAEIVLVAFGAPLQEKWIAGNLQDLNAKVVMGVGGLFDFYSGNTKRAPRWLREIGMEWSYRFIQEPGRMWERYIIGNPLFLWRVATWKLNGQEK